MLQNNVLDGTTGYLHISKKTLVPCNPLIFYFFVTPEASLCVHFQKYMYHALDFVQQALPVQ